MSARLANFGHAVAFASSAGQLLGAGGPQTSEELREFVAFALEKVANAWAPNIWKAVLGNVRLPLSMTVPIQVSPAWKPWSGFR